MKLNELLEKIKKNPKVKDLKLIEKHPPYYHIYKVLVRETEDLVREMSICIIVLNEGTEKEEAYFKDSKPYFLLQERHPLEELREKIVNECKIIKLESFVINSEENYAVVTGFVMAQEGQVTRKSFLAYLDENNNLVIYEIVR